MLEISWCNGCKSKYRSLITNKYVHAVCIVRLVLDEANVFLAAKFNKKNDRGQV